MNQDYWLGPTYEFRSEDWTLAAGIPVETGRLEWLLGHLDRNGVDVVSHSFVLEPNATCDDLEMMLGELPPEVMNDLVAQVQAHSDPPLLSGRESSDGLA